MDVGERPGKFGFIGILLVTAGAYLLHVHTTYKGILEPFRAIGRERGSVLMIIVAFIYSITSNLGKMAIQHSSPVFFGCVYPLILGAVLFPFMKYKSKAPLSMIISRPKI